MAYSWRGQECRMGRKPWHGSSSRKRGEHISSALRKTRESRKWEGAGCNTSKPAAAVFSPTRFPLFKVQCTPPKSVTSRGQNIKHVNQQGNNCLSNNQSLCESHIQKNWATWKEPWWIFPENCASRNISYRSIIVWGMRMVGGNSRCHHKCQFPWFLWVLKEFYMLTT